MFEKLDALKNQYDELTARMELPETYSDAALYARCEREARELAPIVSAYTAYKKAEADMAGGRRNRAPVGRASLSGYKKAAPPGTLSWGVGVCPRFASGSGGCQKPAT